MKHWFLQLAGWQKTVLHFILFFIIYLALYLGFHLLWPGLNDAGWKDYLAQAFVFSFILEAFINWLLVVPNYFKKKSNEPVT
jgi:hypothetical protein